MKLYEIFNIRYLDETLNSSLPFTKLTNYHYDIDIGDQHRISVLLYPSKIQGYNCLGITFINPRAANIENRTAVTKFFNGPSAVRIFSTMLAIIKPIPFELLIVVPDDIDVEVEHKKLKLYNVVFGRLRRIGATTGHQVVQLPMFDKPIIVGFNGSRSHSLSEEQVKEIVQQFEFEKLTHG